MSGGSETRTAEDTPDEKAPDETLYTRYLGGSEEALRELLERHRESLALFLFGIVGSMEDAEDLMLEAFAQVAADDGRFQRRSSFRTYLFAVGRNLACKSLRKRRLRPLRFGEDAPAPGSPDDPDLCLLRKEENRQLYEGLSRLPPDYRSALYLLYFEDMSYAEAARVLGKTVKQITNLAYRGKQALRQQLEKDGYSYAGA
jgi:RNA polymerase sigma factor (sigma-70 family)